MSEKKLITQKFCNKTKYQIKQELIDLGFSNDNAAGIVQRMEDQIRDDLKNPVDNFELFCFDLCYYYTSNGLQYDNLKTFKR